MSTRTLTLSFFQGLRREPDETGVREVSFSEPGVETDIETRRRFVSTP